MKNHKSRIISNECGGKQAPYSTNRERPAFQPQVWGREKRVLMIPRERSTEQKAESIQMSEFLFIPQHLSGITELTYCSCIHIAKTWEISRESFLNVYKMTLELLKTSSSKLRRSWKWTSTSCSLQENLSGSNTDPLQCAHFYGSISR